MPIYVPVYDGLAHHSVLIRPFPDLSHSGCGFKEGDTGQPTHIQITPIPERIIFASEDDDRPATVARMPVEGGDIIHSSVNLKSARVIDVIGATIHPALDFHRTAPSLRTLRLFTDGDDMDAFHLINTATADTLVRFMPVTRLECKHFLNTGRLGFHRVVYNLWWNNNSTLTTDETDDHALQVPIPHVDEVVLVFHQGPVKHLATTRVLSNRTVTYNDSTQLAVLIFQLLLICRLGTSLTIVEGTALGEYDLQKMLSPREHFNAFMEHLARSHQWPQGTLDPLYSPEAITHLSIQEYRDMIGPERAALETVDERRPVHWVCDHPTTLTPSHHKPTEPPSPTTRILLRPVLDPQSSRAPYEGSDGPTHVRLTRLPHQVIFSSPQHDPLPTVARIPPDSGDFIHSAVNLKAAEIVDIVGVLVHPLLDLHRTAPSMTTLRLFSDSQGDPYHYIRTATGDTLIRFVSAAQLMTSLPGSSPHLTFRRAVYNIIINDDMSFITEQNLLWFCVPTKEAVFIFHEGPYSHNSTTGNQPWGAHSCIYNSLDLLDGVLCSILSECLEGIKVTVVQATAVKVRGVKRLCNQRDHFVNLSLDVSELRDWEPELLKPLLKFGEITYYSLDEYRDTVGPERAALETYWN